MPHEELPQYADGEPLRDVDLALLDHVRGEYTDMHSAALVNAGVGIEAVFMQGRAMCDEYSPLHAP